MATTKKPVAKKTTTKKTSTKKAVKKYSGLSSEDKRVVWLAVTVIVVILIYCALTYFA